LIVRSAKKKRSRELLGFGEKAFPEMSRDGKYLVNWNTDMFAYPIGTNPIYQ
jgi:hypothetical protein